MKFALVDIRIPDECEASLTRLGYEVIKLPPYQKLPAPLSSHPDMLLHLNGDSLIVNRGYYEENIEIFKRLEGEGEIKLILSDEHQTDKYPYDAIFNALSLGDKILLRKKSVSKDIIRLAEEYGLDIINTNQGYPACTTLCLTSEHIITADLGIKGVAEKNGIKVTLIEACDISLPPYEYGFIGGASGVDNGCVYFFGDIKMHRCYDIIQRAIEGEGLTPVSLGRCPLYDLGGIIFIPKKCEKY